MKYYHMISIWGNEKIVKRAGNPRVVETILNDIVKGLPSFESNHVPFQEIRHLSHFTKKVTEMRDLIPEDSRLA